MPIKPSDIEKATIYTYWDSEGGFTCPLCSSSLRHEFNNGGRISLRMDLILQK
ncbi:unnamed protein product, partial [marine sediment metagenome]